jgi:sarcosine oxidase subunit gamma
MPDGLYVTIRPAEPAGMVTLRGDLAAAKLKAAVKSAAGTEVPPPRGITRDGDRGAAWMAPDELLLFCPPDAAPALVAALEAKLKGLHHLAADTSDLRAGWVLEGAALREVLAKLTPADMQSLHPGEIRRTRLAQAAAAIWLESSERAHILAFRSVADYVTALLTQAAQRGGEVG